MEPSAGAVFFGRDGLHETNAHAHNNLGVALAGVGRLDEEIEHFAAAARLNPGSASAKRNLERAIAKRDALRGGGTSP